MKKVIKRAAALLCVVMMIMSMMITPAAAYDNVVVLDVSYLNKEKCWIEAENYMSVTGLSRIRIAAEIYAHAMADNLGNKLTTRDGIGDRWLWDYLVKHAHEVNIGGEEDVWWMKPLVNIYYNIWMDSTINTVNTCNTYYYIHSKLNWNKVVDVSGNGNQNGTKIQLYSQNYTDAQQFAFYKTNDSSWTIFKKNTFSTLDVAGGVAANCTKVQLYGYNGTAAQDWILYDAGDGYYYIQNRLGYFMDAAGGNSANGTQIWTYTFNGSDAQKWGLEIAS